MEININYHFKEIKYRFIYIFISLTLTGYIAYENKEKLFFLIAKPLIDNNVSIVYTNVSEAFFTYLKLSIFISLFLNLPLCLLHLHRYIKSGKYFNENKKWETKIKIWITYLILGQLWFINILSPCLIQFFIGFIDSNLSMIAKISELYKFYTNLIIINTLSFSIPCFLIFFKNFNIFIKYRHFGFILILFLSGLVTPPDIFSQLLLALPISIFIEISYFLALILRKYQNI